MSADRLVVSGLKKSFGATRALGGVGLRARAGEVHALVGENGAGKSTLLKILAGVQPADGGTITLDGVDYRPRDPIAARRAGVAMVHQELSLCPHLSVVENVLLGDEPTRFGIIDAGRARARADAVLRRVLGERRGAIDLDARVGELPPALQQLVEIARALALPRCRVIILDEPTSSLARDDAERLFTLVRALRDEGLTVLYVSHFLEEVERLADRYTVLRDGASVTAGTLAGTTRDAIVQSMAGRAIEQLFPRSERTPGEVVLTVRGLGGAAPVAVGAQGGGDAEAVRARVDDASFELRRGEVLGIAGLVGAGRTELVRAIFGLDPVLAGEVRVASFVASGERGEGGAAGHGASPRARWAQRVGFVSEDRKGEGLAGALSIADNVTLSRLAGLGPGPLVLPHRQAAATQTWIERLSIRCRDARQSVVDLSGGNQQKVAIARLLHHDVDVFILDEPTRGIDVGSKAQIYALIDELAAAGKAVLRVSSPLPELLGVCDRVAVMRRGRLGAARPARALTEHDVLLEATGT
ncbi:MAG: sugar ABC transporter ATP-binding protein [Polyangiales bacterium]